MALRILKDKGLVASLVGKGKEDTAAQFQERCLRLALDLHWEMYRGGNGESGVGHESGSSPHS
jgi:hypothetical protein